MEKNSLKHLIYAAGGREPADIRVTNCHIVDVFNKEVFDGDLLIQDGVLSLIHI